LMAALLTMPAYYAHGQGCSDAGFCTLNSFKPNSAGSIEETKHQFKVGFSFGGADHSISTFGNYIEYNTQLNEKFSFDAKITSLSQNGNEISVYGLSDVFLNANYKMNSKARLTVGTKIPLTKANKMKNNLSLPMDYQSSLGTFDIIVGLGYEIKNVQLVAALQQPLTQNSNGFLAENYPLNSKLSEFQSTNRYKRSGDILLRVSYPIILGNKFSVTPGILPIYHLANDTYTDAFGVENEIAGSQGLTLNGNLFVDYAINSRNALQLNTGMPFMVRKARPDGLTRSFVVNLEYRIKF
jgi:hypothetical protein